MDFAYVNGKEYKIIKELGKGKGGYSYLVISDGEEYVLKKIHHEPVDYFEFGDKIGSEYSAYQKLVEMNIKIPKLFDIDFEQEIIIKEYINGPTIEYLVKQDNLDSNYISQVRFMADIAKEYGYNLDYYPTNFIVSNGNIYYIDYELNEYSDKWNFENWGMEYWRI